jgi:hypothetical protein
MVGCNHHRWLHHKLVEVSVYWLDGSLRHAEVFRAGCLWSLGVVLWADLGVRGLADAIHLLDGLYGRGSFEGCCAGPLLLMQLESRVDGYHVFELDLEARSLDRLLRL